MSGSRNPRHSRARRLRRWVRDNQRLIILGTVLFCIVAAAGTVWVYKNHKLQASRHVSAGNSVNMRSGYRNITYKGKKYQYNSLITTILYAGIDSDGTIEETAYTDAPRADSISLVILNKKTGKISILSINRDAMTEVRRFTLDGTDRGTYVSHLCIAYTYGNGVEASCENLREAVSNLLMGIPINEYVVSNRSSLPYLNRLVGGVTIKVPNDDLEEKYPEFQEGATVTLDDTNIEHFLRSRDITIRFTNEGRLQRQKTYILAYLEKLRSLPLDSVEELWREIDGMDDYLLTSITKNKYLKLAEIMKTASFDEDSYYTLEGRDEAGELHDEFYVDENALKERVLELFYEEI